MLPAKTLHRVLWGTCLLPGLLLSACGGSDGNYPKDWPLLATRRSAHGCSDLRGTYQFDTRRPDDDTTTFSLVSSFLGAGVQQTFDAPLRLFTVEGDAETQLTVSFVSAHAATTSAPASDAPSPSTPQTITVRRGQDYSCEDGWLVGKVKHELLVTYARHDHHDYKDLSLRHGALGPQTVRLRRDAEGGLVGRSSARIPRVISLWAETGAGIPYWYDDETYWTRWMPTQSQPPVQVMPKNAAQAARMERLQRQENDLENGTGAAPR